jgi:hypothetical protein
MRNDNAENIALSRCFAAFLVEHTGAAVEFNIHRPDVEKGQDSRNIHVHFMFTPRRLGPYGFEDKLPAMREGKAFLIHMRKAWEEMCNEFLLQGDIRNAKGEIEQISMDTLEAQGIDRLPQIHEGPKGRAMQQEGRTPVSSVKEDGNGRAINYPEIDNGKTRGEYNAVIIELNTRKEEICGPININTQIENVERQIDIHLENIAEIEALLPLNFLPEHIRAKLRVAIERFQKLLFMRLFEKMAMKKRKKELETLRLQRRVERLRLALLDYERKQSRLLAVKYLYLKMNANYLYVDHALIRVNAPKPLVTRLDFREKIKVNSKALRMNVIPEYRPKLKERHSRYEDNGGKATPPPSIRQPFNDAAQGVVPKQKVKVTFGPHAQRSSSP